MALDAVANFVRGTTDAAVDNTATTLSVTDATIFPDPGTQGEYNVVIWDAESFPRPDQDPSVEVLRVTAIDTGTDELTVTRGQEGTSGASHPSGSAVHLSPTAKMFSDIESRYTAAGEDFDGQGTSDFTNLQSVDTESVGFTAGGQTSTWEVVATDEDTDETTAYTFDSGAVTAHDAYAVIGYIAGHGSGASGEVDVTINNITSADYRFNTVNSGAVSETTGASAWSANLFDQNGYQVGWMIRGSQTLDSANQDRPTIAPLAGIPSSQSHILNGEYTGDVGDVTSVQVSTAYNARGQLVMYGVDYR